MKRFCFKSGRTNIIYKYFNTLSERIIKYYHPSVSEGKLWTRGVT